VLSSSNNLYISSTGVTGGSTQRDMSIESGYHSFSSCSSPVAHHYRPGGGASVGSTGSLASRSRQGSRFRFFSRALQAVRIKGQSLSEDFRETPAQNSNYGGNWQSRSTEDNTSDLAGNSAKNSAAAVGAEDRRRLYQNKAGAFNAAVHDDEDEPRCESRGSSIGANSVYGSSVFTGSLSSLSTADAHEMVALTLGDFRFRYRELELGQLVAATRSGHTIRRGKCQVWDVVIHSCCPNNDEEVRDWLADVRRLTQIRHENIVLYMGACVEPPQFAIITSLIKADSLQAHLDLPGGRLSSAAKLAVIRQTANAFSYLHCRGILHGRLSAHNIFLESTVKVSLLDYAPDRLNLQYYAPEIAQQLRAEAPHLPANKSQAGDVFAFGTLVYMLACSRLPFSSGVPADVLLYQVGRGCLSAGSLPPNIHPGLSRLIGRCWEYEAASRPTFPTICNQLQTLGNSFSSARKHSSSEPRNLDQLGKVGTGLLAVN
jgi:serine/threonine protein kinase